MTNEVAHLSESLSNSDEALEMVHSSTVGAAKPPAPVQETPAGTLGGSWTTPAIAILGVGLAVFTIRKFKANAKAFERSTTDALLEDVLDAVAKNAPNRSALRAELAAAVEGAGTLRTEPLSSILRIEESYEKKPSGKYLRRVSVLRRKDESAGSLVKVESEVGWEYVPDSFREKFIETRDNKVVRRIYDAKGNP